MNRLLLILVTFVFSSAAYAYNPKDIYEALDVQEFHLNPGVAGHSRVLKSVGGLTCLKSRLMNSEATYECELLQDILIPEDIEQGYPIQEDFVPEDIEQGYPIQEDFVPEDVEQGYPAQ